MAQEETTRLDKFKEQAAYYKNKFKFDRHHTIERFAVTTGAFLVTGVFIFVGCIFSIVNSDKGNYQQQAIYNTEFVSSRTENSGQIDGVYSNSDNTRAFVLMHFANPEEMSASADDYYAYVTGMSGGVDSGPSSVAQPTVGSIYSFGTGGYLGVMLDAPGGFKNNHLMNITLRAKKELTDPEESDTGENGSDGRYSGTNSGRGSGNNKTIPGNDASFDKYDQWRVVVNPGADDVTVISALDGDTDPEPVEVYSQTVIRDDEVKLRYALNDDLAKMKRGLDRANSYMSSLESTRVTVGADRGVHLLPPDLPEDVAGDTVTGLSSDELSEQLEKNGFDVPGIKNKTDYARELDGSGSMPNTYVLNSENPVSGGLRYDWRSHTIFDGGYIEEAIPAGRDPLEYLGAQYSAVTDNGLRDMNWMLSNGTALKDLVNGSGDNPSVDPLVSVKSNIQDAFDAFYKAKTDYERTHLRDLLMLNIQANTIGENSSVAHGDAVDVKN